jgi:DNA/RNA endonuclease YhcR with UshA esterase domain
MIGNVVRLTGTVTDYYGLTEIKNLTSYNLLQIRHPLPYPLIINTGKISKNYQSMFVRLNNVTCTALADGSGNWQVADGSGKIMVHNSSAYSFTPTLNQKYDVQGILTYYSGTWRIELRKSGDVEAANEIFQIDNASNIIRIYPNPAKGFITIQVKEQLPVQTGVLRIFSTAAKLYYSEKISFQDLEAGYQVNLKTISSGSWILSLKHSEGIVNKVFIINR